VIVKYPTVAVVDATIPYSTSSSAPLLGSLVGVEARISSPFEVVTFDPPTYTVAEL
jgi:hypothetical protein